MEIRYAVPGDENEIARLLGQLHPDQPVAFRTEKIRQGARSFVAAEADEALGFALATFVDYGLSSYGMIEELVVDAGRRGGGIGTALVDACREWLGEQQVEVVFVSALEPAAEMFYQQLGFVRCTGPWLYWVPPSRPV
jgi:N-acetylglutamate synthase-like GNAT family acetyltransferase